VKVFDVFPFFNELDLLEIRLNLLDPFVDEFVITEADETFSGLSKPYYATDNLSKFSKFADKITIQKISNIPSNLNPFERDRYQRDSVQKILLEKMMPEDILIYGDIDEIPNPNSLDRAIFSLLSAKTPIIHMAQDIYYCYLNQKEVSGTLLSYTGEYKWIFKKKWLGTNVSKWDYAKNFLPTDLRDPLHKSRGLREKEGGWHFSYIGSDEITSVVARVDKKIRSAAHQEFNQPQYIDFLSQRILNSQDIFSRRRSKFRILNDLTYLPDYILNNISKYQHLIRP